VQTFLATSDVAFSFVKERRPSGGSASSGEEVKWRPVLTIVIPTHWNRYSDLD
jgi:hypothetical protein